MLNIFHILIYFNKNHCILITEAVLTQNWTKCIYGGKGKKGFLWKMRETWTCFKIITGTESKGFLKSTS